MSFLIRRTIPVALAAAILCGAVALATVASADPVASAAKSKCKKKKKSAAAAKKKKCKKGGGGSGAGGSTLPGSPTNPTPVQPTGSGPPPAAPTMSSVSLTNATVLSGDSTQGQVTISGAAPSGGQTVALQSSDPSRASVPPNVQVAEGQTTAIFPIATTPPGGTDATVMITGSIGVSSANAQLDIVQEPSMESLTLDHQCYPPSGTYTANRVTLDVPAPTDTPVGLLSSAPASLSVPTSVMVPEDAKTALFPVNALASNPAVTVTGSLNSTSAQDTASVRDGSSPAPVVVGLDLDPTTVQAGSPSLGTVTLDCEALAGGSTVTLSSDNPDVTFPDGPSVTVDQDKLTATFTINTSAMTTDADAVITATLGNVRQATLTIDNLDT